MSNPPCPRCGGKRASTEPGGFFRCAKCDAIFDDDPEEGGSHGNRPDQRMLREERERDRARGKR